MGGKESRGADSYHDNGQKLAPKLLRKSGRENIGQYSLYNGKISKKSTVVYAKCDIGFL